MKSDKWLRYDKNRSKGEALPLVFAALLRPFTTALKNVAPKLPERAIVELDKDGNPIRSSVGSDVPASSF